MNEQKNLTEVTEQAAVTETAEQKTAAKLKEKNGLFTTLAGFVKSHQMLMIYLAGLITICLVIVAAISAIHAVQAKRITHAMNGKCFITSFDNRTEIYSFTEDDYADVYIRYTDGNKKGVSTVIGSLDDYHPVDITISLFGKMYLSYHEIEINEQNIIVSSDGYPWEPISLEEALKIQAHAVYIEPLGSACINAAIGTDGFLTEVNTSLASAIKTYDKDPASDKYITAAKSLLSKTLKNPSSAIYNTERVEETDDYGRAIVYLDVSGQNSFGGYVRSHYYICITGISSSGGTYHYNPNFYKVDDIYSLDTLKFFNDWNEDRSENDSISNFKPSEPNKTTSLEVNGFTLDRYEFTSENVTYATYIEPVTQYVFASEIIVPKAAFNQMGDSEKSILGMAIDGIANGISEYCSGWSKIFDIKEGLLSNDPYFSSDKQYCFCAKEKNGSYYISVTNLKALGCDETNYWSPIQ